MIIFGWATAAVILNQRDGNDSGQIRQIDNNN
jgi:hypothetical protein